MLSLVAVEYAVCVGWLCGLHLIFEQRGLESGALMSVSAASPSGMPDSKAFETSKSYIITGEYPKERYYGYGDGVFESLLT